MSNLPVYVYAIFIGTLVAAAGLYYRATNNSRVFTVVLLGWMALQGLISTTGFYTIVTTPPRLLLLVAPPMLVIIILFSTHKGRAFINGLQHDWLTLFSVVRVPVELTLLWLYQHHAVPQLMTFEGRNFDILAGITAPIVYYWGYRKPILRPKALLLWNLLSLALLLNIVINALISAPGPQQAQAFDQPNVAILHAPFTLLPAVLVPLVLLSHLVNIRHLLMQRR